MLQALIDAVREVAMQEVMPHFLKIAHARKADGSVFTAADLATQDALCNRLAAISDCPVVGEEMSRARQVEEWLAGSQGLWCVDPIDGTSNFVSGIPHFALSVAFLRGGRTVLGVTFNPMSGELFCAEAGAGAYLNGERLPLKQGAPRLREAMAGIDFKRLPRTLACALAAEPPYFSQRNYGASTLEWCYAASGRFDVYLHGGQKLWDYAAGSLILAEAGGAMCSLEQDDFWQGPLWQRSVVAARDAHLLEEWKSWLRAHR